MIPRWHISGYTVVAGDVPLGWNPTEHNHLHTTVSRISPRTASIWIHRYTVESDGMLLGDIRDSLMRIEHPSLMVVLIP